MLEILLIFRTFYDFQKKYFFFNFLTPFSKIEVFWLDWSNVMCEIDSESDFRDDCVLRIFLCNLEHLQKKIYKKCQFSTFYVIFKCNFSISRKRILLEGFYTIFEWDRPNKECVWMLRLIWETLDFSKKNFIKKKFSIFFWPKKYFLRRCV